ncbi:hypothetical protein [Paenibacillus sp. YAF4_2]|uniref:hypothetical protein n=1 Tax=Paenibacillus sp. YAF4_2 TaxID=3233085 RepID=UPI003F9D8EF3
MKVSHFGIIIVEVNTRGNKPVELENNKEQNDCLLYYMGCGNLPEADILFLGNEEGAGGYNIEANVEARYQCYGTENGELTYAVDPGDYSKG